MKHGSNIRRGGGGGGGRPPRNNNNIRRFHGGGGGHRHSNFESSGPEMKVRGSAQQVLEKYLAMARDAASGGDRIAAENYLQHAEHYYRIINFENANRQGNGGQRPSQGQGQQPQGQQGQQPQQPQGQGQHQPTQPPMPTGYDGGSDSDFDQADQADQGYAADPRSTTGNTGGGGPAQG
ncbi:MAG: DUF4167 domain-containing protein [Rhodospirillales bacterium]|nr:DUF4167 domain-containing protein [Rhodospirillales bacterium]